MSRRDEHLESSPHSLRRTHADPDDYPTYVATQRVNAPASTLIGLKPTGIDVHFPDEQVLHYDLAGRLLRIAEPYCQWRRGLSGRMLEVSRRPAGRSGHLERRLVEPSEAAARLDAAAHRTRAVADALQSESAVAGAEPTAIDRLTRVVARAAAFDATVARADVVQFRALYHDIPVLPPDQYLSFVLAATDGCKYNQCTFCGLYRDVPFRRRSAAEFREHVRAALEYFGDSLTLRRTVFLGQADALLGPRDWREEVLRIVNESCTFLPPGESRCAPGWWQGAGHRFAGITSFLDGFAGRRISAEEFAALRALHLRQVFVGLESGAEALLRWLRKPSPAEEVVAAVRAAKQGGVQVGVILLIGAGGERFFDEHVRDTIALVRAMQLEPGDYVYLSPLVAAHGAEYAEIAAADGIAPLSPTRLAAQEALLRQGLRQPRGPYVARYEVDDFVY